jgi:hypothetical protein
MSDMVIIYESDEAFWAEKVIDELLEEGFHPELADDAGAAYHRRENKNPGLLGIPPGRMKVSVVVPSQEEAAARLFLQNKNEQAGSNVDELTGSLRKPMILSIIASVGAAILMACLSDEPGACVLISLMCVFPASFIITASSVFVENETGQIIALMIIITAVTVGTYCLDKALVYIGCFLWGVPFLGIAYVFFRTHKFARSRKKDDSF